MSITGLCGALSPKSRLLTAVRASLASARGAGPAAVVDFSSVESAVRRARYRTELCPEALAALRLVEAADGLVVALPLENGTVSGLFKHMLDMLDRESIAGKPAIVLADAADLDAAPVGHLHARLVLESLGLAPVRETIAVSRHAVSLAGDVADDLAATLARAMADLVGTSCPALPAGVTRLQPRSSPAGLRS